jgi:hypothetical protein
MCDNHCVTMSVCAAGVVFEQLRTILLENLRHVSAVDGSAVEVDPAVLAQAAQLSAGQVG